MLSRLTHTVLAVSLLIVLAACSRPAVIPSLSEVAADTAALTSFVALVDALDMDLDAATQTGLFTVFAPSNDLLDAYAESWGFADAAALLAADLTDDQVEAAQNFVLAHVVLHMPGLLTEEFLTEDIADTWWYWDVETDTVQTIIEYYTEVGKVGATRMLTLPDEGLYLYFWGSSANSAESFEADLYPITFVASDVPFKTGIVHVIDGDVGAFFF